VHGGSETGAADVEVGLGAGARTSGGAAPASARGALGGRRRRGGLAALDQEGVAVGMDLHLARAEVLAGRERVLAGARLDDGAARDERAQRAARDAAFAGRDVAAREEVVEGEGTASMSPEHGDETRGERVLVGVGRRGLRVVVPLRQAAARAPARRRAAGPP